MAPRTWSHCAIAAVRRCARGLCRASKALVKYRSNTGQILVKLVGSRRRGAAQGVSGTDDPLWDSVWRARYNFSSLQARQPDWPNDST